MITGNLSDVRLRVIEIVHGAAKEIDTIASAGFTTRSKGGVDFATEADDAVDALHRKELSISFPTTSFLTEETAPSDYISFSEKEDLWVIDPIDGTTNFSRGSGHYAISVGLVSKGKPKIGVIYLPKEQKLYYAQEDKRESFVNDMPLDVSSVASLEEALVCADWSWDIEKRKKTLSVFTKILPNVRAIQSRGSACAEIASVASGTIDAYYNYGLKPWDIAAGLLIAEKAGAKIYDLQHPNDQWSVFSPDLLFTNGVIDQNLLSYFPEFAS